MMLPTLPKRANDFDPSNDPARIYLDSLEVSGRRPMGVLLKKVAYLYGYTSLEVMPWENLRYEHLAAIKSMLHSKTTKRGSIYSNRSINTLIYAVRGVAKAAHKLQLINSDELLRLIRVKTLKFDNVPPGHIIEHDELVKLLAACRADDRPAGIRDLAIIHSLYIAGLHRTETARLTLNDLTIWIHKKSGERRAGFRFIGEGKKEAICRLDNKTLSALDDWLAVRGFQPGPLFCAINKYGKLNLHRHMSDQAIYDIVIKRSAQARIPFISPKDIRRTLAHDLLNTKKIPINDVKNIMRHSDIRTTAIIVSDHKNEVIDGLGNET